jgi:hypothetical protein
MTSPLAALHGIVFDPILPIGAIALLGAAMAILTIAVYWRVGSRLSVAQNLALTIFRLLGLALVLLLLLQPSRVEEIPPPMANRVTLVAVDDSRSMAQKDVEQGTRSQAARALLSDAGLIKPDGAPSDHDTRMFAFGEDAAPLKSAGDLNTSGPTTRVHRSISTILSSLGPNDVARALLVFSDGHDFELVNPAKTGFLARQRGVPIYAVALGKQGKVRDVSVRITSYQPYCYVKQKARISAALRLIGCELETLHVELARGDQIVQTQTIQTGDEPEIAVNFDVTEPAVGQYEYEIRVRPLPGETDVENNRALTYLNVIDQQIQVLFLEGSPYWDTTFLQRSLLRNDKMNVDSVVQYAEGKARVVRKKADQTELKIPATEEDWRRYDVVVLGRSVDKLLKPEAIHQLEDYVKNHGGTVIFSRGRAFGDTNNELEPVIWSPQPTEHVRLQVAREGQALAPFRTITGPGSADTVPDLIASYGLTDKKPLTETLATAQANEGGEPVPGMVHRRFGEGQVLSVGVDGLWRWAFNARIEGVNTLFDRFWDQMILWLMAGRDFLPTQQYALRANSANIPLGEKIYFRAIIRDTRAPAASLDIPLTITHDGAEAGRTSLRPDHNASDRVTADFLAAKPGKYTATAKFPDGSTQSVRFVAFDDNLEQTEVATDTGYLRKLCESSGGRLLQPNELSKLLDELKTDKVEATPMRKLTTAWDRAWVFWLIGLLFGMDWYLRRRWGLA